MTDPNDPCTPRIRTQTEKMALMQQIMPSSGGTVPSWIDTEQIGGLTKREYFAAMAMQGVLAWRSHPAISPSESTDLEKLVRESVRLSDALIKELSK